MTSSRFPGKVVRPILGRPMFELLVERLRRARSLDDVVLATTTNRDDDVLVDLCGRIGISYFRGSEDDVLDRVLRAAQTHGVDVIVEVTGDNPLIDPDVIDRVVARYMETDADFVSNTLQRTYPLGLDTKVFSRAALEEVASLTQDPADHEHVSLYIYRHPDRFTLENVGSDAPQRHRDVRLTVDTPEDLSLVRAIYEELYPVRMDFTLGDVLALLDRRPDLVAINSGIPQRYPR